MTLDCLSFTGHILLPFILLHTWSQNCDTNFRNAVDFGMCYCCLFYVTDSMIWCRVRFRLEIRMLFYLADFHWASPLTPTSRGAYCIFQSLVFKCRFECTICIFVVEWIFFLLFWEAFYSFCINDDLINFDPKIFFRSFKYIKKKLFNKLVSDWTNSLNCMKTKKLIWWVIEIKLQNTQNQTLICPNNNFTRRIQKFRPFLNDIFVWLF